MTAVRTIGSGIASIVLIASCVSGAALTGAGADSLEAGYARMYNLQFDAAHQIFHQWENGHPADPMGPISDAAAYLFSEFDRLHILQSEFFVQSDLSGFRKPPADPAMKQKFEDALAQGGALADQVLAKSPSDADGTFAEVMRLGLHADYLALIEKRNLASLSEVKQGRLLAEKLLAAHPKYYDAYIAVGLENYLLSLKPAPVRWLLHATGAQTDKQTGIDKLKLTAEKGHYLLPYAQLLLAVADLRDHNTAEAKQRLSWLSSEFPGNNLYKQELAKLK